MQDISKVHKLGFPEKQLEEIEIFFSEGNAGAPSTLTLSSGEWKDLDRIELTAGFTTIPDAVNTTIVYKKDLVASPTGWIARVRVSSATFYEVYIKATSSNTASVTYTGTSVGLKSVIGYKKRYAVENNSVIIPVNGGLNVEVNKRYEVDLPAEFYEADGSVKKGVQVRAELNLSGVVYSGWAESELDSLYVSITTDMVDNGCRARILGNKVVVDTAGYGNQRTANKQTNLVWSQIQNPWGMATDIDAAPCRVVATLNDAYQIQKYELHSMSADAELEGVVLYDGARILPPAVVPLNDDLSNYEYIKIQGEYTQNGSAQLSAFAEIATEYLLTTDDSYIELITRNNGSAYAELYIYIVNSTANSLALAGSTDGTAFTQVGVSKVVGYKKRYTSQNQSVVIPVNGGANVGVNQRYVLQLPPQFYGLDGKIKSGVQVRAEIYNDGAISGDVGWGETGVYNIENTSNVPNSYFASAKVLGSAVVVQTGITGLMVNSNFTGSPFNFVGVKTSAPCRVVATLNDALAVKSQAYGSLITDDAITSVTPQDLSGVGATPTVIEFHISGEDNGDVPMNVVESTANNSLTLNVAGRWMPDLAIALETDSSANERVLRVELYNATDAVVVKSKPHSIIKNQTKHLIDFDRVFRLANVGKQFQIRMYIESGSFSKLDVVHADWTVDLI